MADSNTFDGWFEAYMPTLTEIAKMAIENPGSRLALKAAWEANSAAYRAMEIDNDELMKRLRAVLPASPVS